MQKSITLLPINIEVIYRQIAPTLRRYIASRLDHDIRHDNVMADDILLC